MHSKRQKRACKQGCVLVHSNQARPVGGFELVPAGIVQTLLLLEDVNVSSFLRGIQLMAESQKHLGGNGTMLLLDSGRAHRVCLTPTMTTSVQALLEQIISECDTLGQALGSLSAKLEKLEKHLEETDHQVEALEAKLMSTQSCVVQHSTLMGQLAAGCVVTDRRLEALENNVRARNLRVTGIPAAVRDANLIPFLENLVASTLDLNEKAVPNCRESARRLPASSAQESYGSTVLITLHDLRHQERILKASWASQMSEFHGRKISFFPDFSPATYARRKRFIAIKQHFLKSGVQAYVLYPAKLKVVHQGKTFIFKDHIPATTYLDRIRQDS